MKNPELTAFYLFILLNIMLSRPCAVAQEPYRILLDSIAQTIPELNSQVDISVSDMQVKELVRILGNSTGLNITVDPQVTDLVSANFNRAPAKDVIEFLCSACHLAPAFYGGILYLGPALKNEKELFLHFNATDSTLAYSVRQVQAGEFFQELTRQSNINFIIHPEAGHLLLNSYAREISLRDAFSQIGEANRLAIREKNKALYSVQPATTPADIVPANNREIKPLEFSYVNGLVSVRATDCSIQNLLANLDVQSEYACHFLNPLQQTLSLDIKNYDLEHFFSYIFAGTDQTYRIDGKNIFAGSREQADLKSCELIRLNNRRVDSLSYILPPSFKKDLVIQEFPEQNSFIVWGDADKIYSFRKAVRDLDVTVPVILIDVIIVDSSESFGLETGIEAGIGDEPVRTGGTINEGLDYTMGATSVNSLAGRIGLSNIGKVTPNFYVKLKALETDNIIHIRSTPQLSTLNGHSASLSIGQTEYYQEETSNIWGTQDPQLVTQTHYRPVEAKLQIVLRPFVTGNGQVSLDINVIQSEFTTRISQYAPPGLVSREFKSKISVKNQDMILLGGLQEQNRNVNSSGWPFLSRVPVLKWIFSSRKDTKSKSNLNIFIKPTVFY